jgi:hypothetical protein
MTCRLVLPHGKYLVSTFIGADNQTCPMLLSPLYSLTQPSRTLDMLLRLHRRHFPLRSLRHIASSPLPSVETSFPYQSGMLHSTMPPFASHAVSSTPHHPITDASSPLSFLETSLSQCPGMPDSTMSPFASHLVSCTRPRPLDDFTTTITSHFHPVPLCHTLCPLVIC